jgi:ABC-2 type transport system permease protein
MTSTLAPAPASATRARWPGSSVGAQILILTDRSLRALIREPQLVVFGLMQPVILLFLFTQVFANLLMTPHFPQGISYVDYLVPAVLIDNAVQSSLQSGVGLVEDLKNGVVSRLRSLPIQPASLLIARSLSDLCRSAVQIVLILVLAIALLGYTPKGGITGILISIGLTLVVSWALGWVFLAVGTWIRKAEPMQTINGIALFPLMFASSAYVPVADLPTWLQIVARANPLTYAVDATRAVALGIPGSTALAPAVVISLVIVVVSFGFAVLGFRRPLTA